VDFTEDTIENDENDAISAISRKFGRGFGLFDIAR
jgi:hypothetical protein